MKGGGCSVLRVAVSAPLKCGFERGLRFRPTQNAVSSAVCGFRNIRAECGFAHIILCGLRFEEKNRLCGLRFHAILLAVCGFED